jgi:hypothetical protein
MVPETLMGDFIKGFAMASGQGATCFQVLSRKDLPRLEAFFLALDFDQRQTYFGGGISDASLRDYCRGLPWSDTIIIARAGAAGIDAIAMLTAMPDPRTADLAIACAPVRDRTSIVADLMELALTAASLSYSRLVVRRSRATPELLTLLDRFGSATFDDDLIRIVVPSVSPTIAPK